jgi:hypothetical protein
MSYWSPRSHFFYANMEAIPERAPMTKPVLYYPSMQILCAIAIGMTLGYCAPEEAQLLRRWARGLSMRSGCWWGR